MKTALKDILGKRVAAVVVAESATDPRHRVFLVFPDGTCFEFYGKDFSCCAGLDPSEGIERQVESAGGKIVRVYGDVLAIPSPRARQSAQWPGAQPAQSTETLLSRDLAAWLEAKAAIAKARGA